jgi:cell division septation protein DedD
VQEKKPETTAKTIEEAPIAPNKEQPPAQLRYTIHVASFKAQKIAGEEVERLLKLGFDAYIETVDLGEKGIWHRVKVGHYATRADAEQTVKSIRQKKPGVKPLIYKNK